MEYFRVIKAFSREFLVDYFGEDRVFSSEKKNKRNSVLVGDFVRIENNAIVAVKERKNKLIRPPIANVDRVIIVICPLPKPDFYLIDKLLITCRIAGIETVICLNKSDTIDQDFTAQIAAQYHHYTIINTSALDKNVDQLVDILDEKVSCLAGQSAVGKSTLINAMSGKTRATGTLSTFLRGKNTTTDIELTRINGGFIADTPGFSLLDLDLEANSLDLYYPEFDAHLNSCKFHRCTHMGEPDCAIEKNVQNGSISAARYSRYKELFTQLKSQKAWEKKYDK